MYIPTHLLAKYTMTTGSLAHPVLRMVACCWEMPRTHRNQTLPFLFSSPMVSKKSP